MMDGEILLGYAAATAWLGVLLYLPWREMRDHGGTRGAVGAMLSRPGRTLVICTLWLGCVCFAVWLCTGNADARTVRDRAEVRAFRQVNACPSTGLYRARCDGWDVDHIKSLCSGGPDRRQNIQWISTDDHKLNSFLDAQECLEVGSPVFRRRLL